MSPKESSTATAEAEPQSEQGVREHDLSPLERETPNGQAGNIDLLMDVTVPVVARLGGTEMRIRDILQLLPGSIVELDKLAGEPVDLLVRGQVFAQGEVVVVDESFGVRITRIMSSERQVANLAAG